jgi:hypothetical protein
MIPHYSHSSTATFRRCKWKFWHLYGDERIDLKTESLGARMGSAGHMGLRGYYLGIMEDRVKQSEPNYKSDWNTLYDTAFGWARYEFDPRDETDLLAYLHLEDVLKSYFRVAMKDKWRVLLVEEKVKVGRWMGILDLVVQDMDTGRVFIVDHKFQKSLQVSHLRIDPQVSFYLMLAQKIDLPVDGLLLNMICTGKQKGDTKAGKIVRTYTKRSKEFLASFEQDLMVQVPEMDEFILHPAPYRNPTKDCVWDCDLLEHCTYASERKANECTICSPR